MTRQQLVDWLRDYLADLLDIAPEEVGTDIPLDHLGVDSATTLVLSADLTARTGRETRPREIFDHPTIDRLADHLSGSGEPVGTR